MMPPAAAAAGGIAVPTTSANAVLASGALPVGSLVAMAQEQEGSRLLQQQLSTMHPEQLSAAVEELAPHLATLATNAFGNYLVSTMAYLPAAQEAIFHALQGHVCRLMQHPQGSRVCQAAVERLPAKSAQVLVEELRGRVSEVACSTHGSWSAVAAYKHTRASFLLEELATDIGKLAGLQNGSRVVQRVLLDAAQAGEDVAAPLDALLGLGPDRLVQLALRHAFGAQQLALMQVLLPSFRALAVEKCGSNVAEVVIELASEAQLQAVREGLGVEGAEELRGHAYGSYVMAQLDARRV